MNVHVLLNNGKYDEFMDRKIKDITIGFIPIEHKQATTNNTITTVSRTKKDNMSTVKKIFSNDTLVKYFIDNNIEATNRYESKLIHYVCMFSSFEMVKYIIDTYIEKGLDIECKDKNRFTPLHYICLSTSEDSIKYMLDIYEEKNLELDILDPYPYKTHFQMNPIHIICCYCSLNSIKYIIEIYLKRGKNLEECTYYDCDVFSPLHLICYYSDTFDKIKYIIDVYLENGYDIDKKSWGYWIRPIHLLCQLNKPFDAIKYLVDKYVENNINFDEDKLLIYYAIEYHRDERVIKYIIDTYLENNFNLDICRDEGKPIHYICRYSSLDIIKYIFHIYIDKGYDFDTRDKKGFRPLDYICQK